jgi:hypothetical protein
MFSSSRTSIILAGISVAVVLVSAPVMAHGHGRHSVNCIFEIEGVQVEILDLSDGVLLTMTSDDEEAVARLQKRAWEQVEAKDSTREHNCFFHMANVQVLVKEVYDGVTLTITSTDEETVAKLQEMARRNTKKGCRHHGHHESDN